MKHCRYIFVFLLCGTLFLTPGCSSESSYTRMLIDLQESTVFVFSTNGGEGTGFVIGEEGYILTSSHVISGAKSPNEIKVFFGEEYYINKDNDLTHLYTVKKFKRFNDPYDLAILKIEPKKSHLLKAIDIASERDAKRGAEIVFLGFQPIDLNEPSKGKYIKMMGGGVVGFLGYSSIGGTETILYLINGVGWPGNSGGPVFLKSGKGVIGFMTNSGWRKMQNPDITQLWLINVVPLHQVKEKLGYYKKEVKESSVGIPLYDGDISYISLPTKNY